MERTKDFDVSMVVSVNEDTVYTPLFDSSVMFITKNGVTIKLEGSEIADVVRTIKNCGGF